MQNVCPNCGANTEGRQFCGSCGSPVSTASPPQQAAYPPYIAPRTTGSNAPPETVRMYYALALFASFVGGLLLLTTEFFGSYNYESYSGIRSETWVSLSLFTFPIPFVLLAVALFFCGFISIKGLQSKVPLPRNLVIMTLITAIIVFLIVLIGTVALFSAFSENDNSWVGGGFYGGAIGSLLIIIFMGLALKNTPKTAPKREYGYGAATPQPTPYPQIPAPAPQQVQVPAPAATQPQPSLAPQPAPQAQEPPKVEEPTPVAQEQPQTQQPPQQQPQQPQQPVQQPQQQYQQPQQPVQQQAQQQQIRQQPQQQYQQPYPQQQQPQYQTPASYPCPKCGQMLKFVPEYKKWYCYTCRKYL